MYEINYDVIMGMMDQTRKRQLWDNLLDLVMDKAKKKRQQWDHLLDLDLN